MAPDPTGGAATEVVVALLTGEQVRGVVLFFNPDKPAFHVELKDAAGKSISREVKIEQVKMVGMLKRPGQPAAQHPPTTKVVTIRFVDGGVIRGMTEPYAGSTSGMFVVPLKSETLERVYIPIASIKEVLSVQKLGDILVSQGAVSPSQVDAAAKQQKQASAEPLGEILVRNQAITREQLSAGLSLQEQYKGTKKIGEILLENNFVSKAQIEEAVEVQKTQRRKRFGEILIDMGFATYKTIAIALAMQCNVPFVDLASQSFHPQLATLLPAAVARRWQVMPVSSQQGILTIAVSDPIDHPGLEEIRKATKMTVLMVVATSQDIQQKITAYYGAAR